MWKIKLILNELRLLENTFKGSCSFSLEICSITKHMSLCSLDTQAKNVFKLKEKVTERRNPLIQKSLHKYKANNISVPKGLP